MQIREYHCYFHRIFGRRGCIRDVISLLDLYSDPAGGPDSQTVWHSIISGVRHTLVIEQTNLVD